MLAMSVHKKNVIYIYILYMLEKQSEDFPDDAGWHHDPSYSLGRRRKIGNWRRKTTQSSRYQHQYEHQHQCYFLYRHQQWQCGIVVKSQNNL